MKNIPMISLLTILGFTTKAQIPFETRDSINVNNINAAVLVHGDMWWNPNAYSQRACFYPASQPKPITFAGAVWLSAFDDIGQLHLSAQTYRQDGNDYWPGPLDATGHTDYTTCEKWAHIWKVSRSEVNAYRATSFHTPANVPPSILHWPGKGNDFARGKDDIPITVDREMAPFVDKDGDGIYEPLKGDYPDFRGDQVLWWVINDNGPSHDQSNGRPLGAEIRCMAYAYKRNTLIDDVVYFDYRITNRSDNNYHNVRFSVWNDPRRLIIPYEYAGFDSVHRMSIAYPSVDPDGTPSGIPANSSKPSGAIVGISFVVLPGDVGGTYIPAGSFMYYENDPSSEGRPTIDTEYNNYMHSRFRVAGHLRHDPDSPFVNTGAEYNYAFPGDPADITTWSECGSRGAEQDRRLVLTSNDFDFPGDAERHILMALVADTTGGACPSISFAGIRRVADTAWTVYKDPLPPLGIPDDSHPSPIIELTPNPASGMVHISCSGCMVGQCSIVVYDLLGQRVAVIQPDAMGKADMDASCFTPGMYNVVCIGRGNIQRSIFVKN